MSFKVWVLRTQLGRLALVAWLVFVGGFAAGVISETDTLVWSAVYLAFTFGSMIGGRRGFNDGADTTMRAVERAYRAATVAAGITVTESVRSLRDDDDRRQQAQNN